MKNCLRTRFSKSYIVSLTVTVFMLSLGGACKALPRSDAPVYDGADAAEFSSAENHKGRDPLTETSPMGVDRPIHAEIKNGGSGNYNLTIELLSLRGRGLDLIISLFYNAHLWDKAAGKMFFDADRGWPAPGWTLGFGKITAVNARPTRQFILVSADGTRHFCSLNFVPGDSCKFSESTRADGGKRYMGRTVDGSFITYTVDTGPLGQWIGGYSVDPSGTRTDYMVRGRAEPSMFASRITDRNGNFIEIRYRNGRGPEIASITDTLGREILFKYDAQNKLSEIVAPSASGGVRSIARIKYRYAELRSARFANASPLARNDYVTDISLIEGIFLPGRRGYWFGDADSYALSGAIKKVSERRGLTWDNTTDNVAPGLMTRELAYDFAGVPMAQLDSTGRRRVNVFEEPAAIPTYTMVSDRWDGMTTPPAVTTYIIPRFDSTTPKPPTGEAIRSDIIRPDGSRIQTLTYNEPGSFIDGMPLEAAELSSDGKQMRATRSTWEKGYKGTARLVRTDEFDEIGQKRSVAYRYGPTANEIVETTEFGFGGSVVLRRTVNDYVLSRDYAESNLFNLLKSRSIFEGSAATPIARTEFQYDGENLTPVPGAVQRNQNFDALDPSTRRPRLWARGNLTAFTRFTDPRSASSALVEKRRYDASGNLILVQSSGSADTAYGFGRGNQYAYPVFVSRGSGNSKVETRTNYQFATGLLAAETDANGNWTEYAYASDTLRPMSIRQRGRFATVPEAEISFVYADFNLSSRATTTLLAKGAPPTPAMVASSTATTLNGLGLVRQIEQSVDAGQRNLVQTEYDILGRAARTSRPFRPGETPLWTQISYDGLGRTIKTVAPDGSIEQVFHNEVRRPATALALPGTTRRTADAWGRERWNRSDALGRLVEVVEPDPKGTGTVFAPNDVATRYTYSALDLMTRSQRGALVSSWVYDGIGRLRAQALAGRTASLSVPGQAERYSDIFEYDASGRLSNQVDPRGVQTRYIYETAGLNRLEKISYEISSIPLESRDVVPASERKFEYRQNGDISQLARLSTAEFSEAFEYDERGRRSSRTLIWSDRAGYPVRFDYRFDAIGRAQELVYPTAYSSAQVIGGLVPMRPTLPGTSPTDLPIPSPMPPAPAVLVADLRPSLKFEYDVASRPTRLTVDDSPLVFDIAYNAASQLTRLSTNSPAFRYGGGAGGLPPTSSNGPIVESYEHDPASGMLRRLTVANKAGALMNLAYERRREIAGLSIGAAQTGAFQTGVTGQVTKIADLLDPSKSREFSYDALSRLSEVRFGERRRFNFGPVVSHQYQYDSAGNRTSSKAIQFTPCQMPCDGSSELPAERRDGVDGLAFDPATNRISTPGYTYDAAGNLTRNVGPDGKWHRYQYNAAGKLVTVTDDGGNLVERHSYDGTGRRVGTRTNDSPQAAKTYFAWHDSQVLSEFVGHDSWERSQYNLSFYQTRSHFYFGSRLAASLITDANALSAEYYHPDHLGTRLVSYSNGLLAHRIDPNAFGTELQMRDVKSRPRRFTSYERSHVSALDYAVNRFYDARYARYTQIDPLGLKAIKPDNPQSLNLYSYTENDPVNNKDPIGLEKQAEPQLCPPGSGVYSVSLGQECSSAPWSLAAISYTIDDFVRFPVGPPSPGLSGGGNLLLGLLLFDIAIVGYDLYLLSQVDWDYGLGGYFDTSDVSK